MVWGSVINMIMSMWHWKVLSMSPCVFSWRPDELIQTFIYSCIFSCLTEHFTPCFFLSSFSSTLLLTREVYWFSFFSLYVCVLIHVHEWIHIWHLYVHRAGVCACVPLEAWGLLGCPSSGVVHLLSPSPSCCDVASGPLLGCQCHAVFSHQSHEPSKPQLNMSTSSILLQQQKKISFNKIDLFRNCCTCGPWVDGCFWNGLSQL